jgi:hypothetical protein
MNNKLRVGVLPIMMLAIFCSSQALSAATISKPLVKTSKKVTGRVLGEKDMNATALFSASGCYKDITARKNLALRQLEADKSAALNQAAQTRRDCEAAVYNESQSQLLADRDYVKEQAAFAVCASTEKTSVDASLVTYHKNLDNLLTSFAAEMRSCVESWSAARRGQVSEPQTSPELTLAQRKRITLSSSINANCAKNPTMVMNTKLELARLAKEAAMELASQTKAVCETRAMSLEGEEAKAAARLLCVNEEKAALAAAESAWKSAEAEARIVYNGGSDGTR